MQLKVDLSSNEGAERNLIHVDGEKWTGKDYRKSDSVSRQPKKMLSTKSELMRNGTVRKEHVLVIF